VLVIDPADLIDAHEVAAIIGVNRGSNVSLYRKRYADFPDPVIEKGRCLLWHRPAIEAWAAGRRSDL
jgi:predicted DNA-binding transcriptional regulator AlpA